jgi:hypothetical protein
VRIVRLNSSALLIRDSCGSTTPPAKTAAADDKTPGGRHGPTGEARTRSGDSLLADTTRQRLANRKQARHRVAFATASQWVDQLAAAHATGKLQAELARLGRYPLLVIVEVQWT